MYPFHLNFNGLSVESLLLKAQSLFINSAYLLNAQLLYVGTQS